MFLSSSKQRSENRHIPLPHPATELLYPRTPLFFYVRKKSDLKNVVFWAVTPCSLVLCTKLLGLSFSVAVWSLSGVRTCLCSSVFRPVLSLVREQTSWGESGVLRCVAFSLGKWFSTFRRNVFITSKLQWRSTMYEITPLWKPGNQRRKLECLQSVMEAAAGARWQLSRKHAQWGPESKLTFLCILQRLSAAGVPSVVHTGQSAVLHLLCWERTTPRTQQLIFTHVSGFCDTDVGGSI